MDDSNPVGVSEDGLEDCVQDGAGKSPSKDTIITTLPGMGSIVYKKIETGEIVASIVRDEDTCSEKSKIIPSSIKSNVKAPSIDDDYSEENEAIRRRRKKKERSLCPINERNVENILDRTLLVTESLQQLLNTFKDELKRAGGGPTFGAKLRASGLKKRFEIARKMTKAYVNYQQAIDNIADLGKNEEELDEVDDDDYENAEDEYYDEGFGKELDHDETYIDHENHQVRLQQSLADKKRAQKKSEPPRNYPAPSRFSEYEDSSRSWREDMVAAKENKYWCSKDGYSGEDLSCGSNVFDDLWMSCEPGSDDETIYNVGFPKGSMKQ